MGQKRSNFTACPVQSRGWRWPRARQRGTTGYEPRRARPARVEDGHRAGSPQERGAPYCCGRAWRHASHFSFIVVFSVPEAIAPSRLASVERQFCLNPQAVARGRLFPSCRSGCVGACPWLLPMFGDTTNFLEAFTRVSRRPGCFRFCLGLRAVQGDRGLLMVDGGTSCCESLFRKGERRISFYFCIILQ